MSRWIDRVLLLVLLSILAVMFAHWLSRIVAGVLATALTPVADALQYALNRARK